MAGSEKKRYGLIQNTKSGPGSFVPRASIFGEDSASDDESVPQGSSDWVKKAFQKESEKTTTKRQTKLNMQRALEEDPTIYQYDEVYDKMEAKKVESKLAQKDIEKKPKYILSLLAQAERRKHENERRTERQVQKEREAEGEEFKDKEAFVTAAYRAKLEEFKKQDEEEQYRERLEALTDVSKQKDLSGFYRHLYRQTVVGEDTEKPVANKSPSAPVDDAPSAPVEDAPAAPVDEASVEGKTIEKTERLYRKRRSSSSSSSSSGPEENPDADSALSDSSSSESEREESDGPAKKKKKTKEEKKVVEKVDEDQPSKEGPAELQHSEPATAVERETVSPPPPPAEEPPKIKINIWLKRTVGSEFDAALERYYIRKAARALS